MNGWQELGLSCIASLYWSQRQGIEKLRDSQLEWQWSAESEANLSAWGDSQTKDCSYPRPSGHRAPDVAWPWSSLLGNPWHLFTAPQTLLHPGAPPSLTGAPGGVRMQCQGAWLAILRPSSQAGWAVWACARTSSLCPLIWEWSGLG